MYIRAMLVGLTSVPPPLLETVWVWDPLKFKAEAEPGQGYGQHGVTDWKLHQWTIEIGQVK